MAQILQGAGGTPVLDEDMLEKMRASGKAYAVEGEDPRIIQAGSVGNATIPMAQYITGTGPEIDLGYTYEPYIPEDKIADIMAEQEGGGSSDDSDDYSDLVTPSGTPMPGHPDYAAWRQAGGEGPPDSQASDGLSSSYTSFTDMFDGGGPGKAGVNFEGGLYSGALNALGVQPYGYEETAATNFESKGMGSVDPGGDGVSSFGGGSMDANDAGVSMGGFKNNGGEIKKYGYGGPVAEQEDPYAAMPVAKAAPMAPLQGALKANQVNTQREKPWYQEVGMGVAAGAAGNALSAGAKMGLSALGLPAWAALFANKGGMVCPCGTPGCPGCGKGYNHGGPISAGGYKEKIAMAESAAKIKRENMKAYADVYKKMKGPLQQGE